MSVRQGQCPLLAQSGHLFCKSAGAAPTSMFAMATTVAADCDRLLEPEVTKTPVTHRDTNKMSENRFGLFPCMRNHLETSSVAQSLDGIGHLAGSLRFPRGQQAR